MGSIRSRVSAGADDWYMDLSTSSQQVSLTTLRPSAALCVCVGKDHGFHSPLLISAHLFYHHKTKTTSTADATVQKDSLLAPLLTNR